MMLMIFSGFLVAGITRFGLAQDYPAQYYSFRISGYILDSDGHGIAGAMIIFNVPQIVPAVLSDSSGHYEIIAPVGTYHVNVWPPFDSHYISYDEPALAVRSDITKNITLTLGYKVSGYITDSSGTPIVKAVVSMDNFFCGWYSKYSGRYFVTAPAGTYTLRARPANGPQDVSDFLTYSESNVVVNGDLAKNITVKTPPPTKISGYVLDAEGNGLAGAQVIFGVPDIVPSVFTNNSGYYTVYAPAGTYHVNVWPPFDSNYLSFDQPELTMGTSDITKNVTLSSDYKLSGYLTDSSGAPVRGALVSLNQFHCGWYSDPSGYYFVTAPAGTYTLTIQPKTGPSFPTYTENNFTLTGDTVKNINLTPANTIISDNFDDGIADELTQHDDSCGANEGISQQDLTVVNTASDGTYTRSSSHVSVNLPKKVDVTPLSSKEYWTWIVAVIIVALIGVSPLVYFRKRKH
jgi:protocatechuate 3,4-dioxygenase beta subunit